MDRRDILTALPVFAGLSERDWDKILDLFSERQYQKDDYIFLEGEAPEALYVVEKRQSQGLAPFHRWQRRGAARGITRRIAGHGSHL